VENGLEGMDNKQQMSAGLDGLFSTDDERWLTLRIAVEESTDVDWLESLYEALGELELQNAYCVHLIEERVKALQRDSSTTEVHD